MRQRQVDFAKNGVPVELILMHDFGWTPWQINRVPNRTVMELMSYMRLKAEVESRGG